MLQRIACNLALGARGAVRLRLLSNEAICAARTNPQLWSQIAPFCSSCAGNWPQQNMQLHGVGMLRPAAWQVQLLPAAAAAAVQLPAQLHPGQQWQQQRWLLGVVKHKNYQDHNQKKPPKYKIKTPSAVKRRVIVGEDGVMWRMQAGRRHKRYKKSKRRLLDLKGMVPLHSADAAKLRKLGYKRKWWFSLKA